MWLLVVSLVVGFIVGSHTRSWMFFSIVLLFTGGIIVLFRYMLTLVAIEKITFPSRRLVLLVTWVIIIFGGLLSETVYNNFRILGGLYRSRQIFSLGFLAIYLFIVLLTVVKLALNFKGALKSVSSNEF